MPARQFGDKRRSILIRWPLACTVDYTLQIGAFLVLALGWPGGHEPPTAPERLPTDWEWTDR